MTATTSTETKTTATNGQPTGRLRSNLLGFGVLLGALVLWELVARLLQSFYFPPFSTALAHLFGILTDPEFLRKEALPSLYRMFIGYGVAAVLGIVIGVLTGSFRQLFRTLDPFFEFFRAIPPPIIIPVGILLLGIGDAMKIMVIAFGTFWPVLLNSNDGARSVSQERLDTAAIFGLRKAQAIVRVVVPSAMPNIFAGLRIGLSLSLIMMVISEMIGSTNGIGYFILDAQKTFRVPDMFAGIALLGVLGYLLNTGFMALENKVLAWHHGQTGTPT